MAEAFINVTEGSGKKLHAFDKTIGANTVLDEVVVNGVPYLSTYVAVPAAVSTATANSHLIQIMAGGTLNVYITRIRIYQTVVATTAAFGAIAVYRLTSAGTGGTVVTPDGLDATDSAAGATGMTLPTVKGAEAARAVHSMAAQFIQTVPTGGNGQATILFDWDYDRPKTKPLRITAGVANGIAIKQITAIAGASVIVNVEFFEANF